jgi:hypothetical protein
MNKTELLTKCSNGLHKIGFGLKKKAPEIAIATGVVSAIVGTVFACKATLKVNDILEKAKGDIETVHEFLADEAHKDEYSEQDGKKDLTLIYVKTGIQIAKIYLPAVGFGVFSLASILCSHSVLKERNVALAAAFVAIDGSFKDYRARVVDKYGEEADRDLRYDIQTRETKETVVDENGKEKKVKKTEKVVNGVRQSDFAKLFDESNMYWNDVDTERLNSLTIRKQEQWANDKLIGRGYLLLNEVYESLGFKPTKAGCVVGWIYDRDNPKTDNYVDFGIRHMKETDYGKPIMLDFNVDGYILDSAVAKNKIEEF